MPREDLQRQRPSKLAQAISSGVILLIASIATLLATSFAIVLMIVFGLPLFGVLWLVSGFENWHYIVFMIAPTAFVVLPIAGIYVREGEWRTFILMLMGTASGAVTVLILAPRSSSSDVPDLLIWMGAIAGFVSGSVFAHALNESR